MKNKTAKGTTKRKTTVMQKLLLPVIILGLAGLTGAISTCYSLAQNQESSKRISEAGIDTIVALDEINLKFEQSQKLALAYCASGGNEGLKEYVNGQIAGYNEKIAEYEEQLIGFEDNFSESDYQLLQDTFAEIADAQQGITDIMNLADTDSDAAFVQANDVMANWTDSIGSNMDVLIDSNDERIHALAEHQKSVFSQSLMLAGVMIAIIAVAFAATVLIVNRSVVRPLKKQERQLNEIIADINDGRGDLTKRLEVKSRDEIGASAEGINHFIATL